MKRGQQERPVYSPPQDGFAIEVGPNDWIKDTAGPCILAIIKLRGGLFGGERYLIQHISGINRRNEVEGLLTRSTNQQVRIVSGAVNDTADNLYKRAKGQILRSKEEIRRRF